MKSQAQINLQIIQLKGEITVIEKAQEELKPTLYFCYGRDNVEDAIELNAVDKLGDYKAFADSYFAIPIPSFKHWYLLMEMNKDG